MRFFLADHGRPLPSVALLSARGATASADALSVDTGPTGSSCAAGTLPPGASERAARSARRCMRRSSFNLRRCFWSRSLWRLTKDGRALLAKATLPPGDGRTLAPEELGRCRP